MSTRPVSRPMAWLAAGFLAIGLIWAPASAAAAPLSSPTPSASGPVVSGWGSAPGGSVSSTAIAPANATATGAAPGSSAPATPAPAGSETPPVSESPAAVDPKTVDPTTMDPTTVAPAEPSPSATPSLSPAAPASPAVPAVPVGPTAQPSPAVPVGPVSGDAIALPGPAAEEPVAGPEPGVAAQAEGPGGITLTKTATPARVSAVGQVVTYRFLATNTGTAALANVAVSDELEGLEPLDCDRPEPVTLQPTEVLRCSATLTVTQEDLDFGDLYNAATVFGDIVGDDSIPGDYVGATAAARVSVDQRPSLGLTASVAPAGTAAAGDRLRYRATAENTGNVTLTAARITASLDGLDLDCLPSARATLAPGERITCSGGYRVTSADARRGRVSTELTARAEAPFGDPGSRRDDVTDSVRLRVKVAKPAGTGSSGLADTGGPLGAVPIGAVGVAALAAGVALLRRVRHS